jgi:hypothetical protein
MPEIRMVVVSDAMIKVFTNPIIINYEGSCYRLGEFLINIDNDYGSVEIHNLTEKCNAYDHPHICDGECCFGSIDDAIAKMVAEYKYAMLIETLIRYLNTVNPIGWYRSIHCWPKVEAT